jgi:hypothetical protein
MLNLIDDKGSALLRTHYRKRLATAAAWLVFILCLAGLAGLAPAYFLGRADLALLKASTENAAAPAAAAALASTTEELNLVASSPSLIEPFIAEAVSAKVPGVSISDFSFSLSPATLQITGISSDRTALVDFVSALEAEPNFSSVDLPVDNLAKDSDIPFTISITLK